ncbi:NUDIX domain-containing protein [Streptomyces sp. NPDC015237]|uniref:NUDIX domain-containing protein n=1 Tax=Streptomyces sp. NPDC015237 TaxID=3364949 RepID=UPI0036F7D4EC
MVNSTDVGGDQSHKVLLVAALLTRDGQVLLCYRNHSRRWYPEKWDLAGGHVEKGETPRDALVREVREELGIDIPRPTDPPVAHFLTEDADMRIWLIKDWSGNPVNAAPGEHSAIAWFTLDEMENVKLAHPRYYVLISRLVGSGQRG